MSSPSSDSASPPGAAPQPAYLAGLNAAQREAVETLDGPVLMLAGAGTGKTRALTARLAHLLLTGRAMPGQILAVTFTNKAAREMKERVAALLGRSVEGWWLGTFHSLAARFLRRHAEVAGLEPNFTILDPDDQLRLMKQILAAEGIDDKSWPARAVLSAVERWKDKGLTPDRVSAGEAAAVANGRGLELYTAYQARLKQLNACDFGDLLLHCIEIFRTRQDILDEVHRQFRYLLVDEYQDTNVAQYLWLRLIAQGHKNICCVGDDDQCLVAGTQVRMADGSRRPIERVREGDLILSAQGAGATAPAEVNRTYRRAYKGTLVAIDLEDGSRIVGTPAHRHFAGFRLGPSPQLCFTYLMYKRGYGFRLGTTQTYTRGQVRPVLGHELRCRQERADALWILETHNSEKDARYSETLLSLESGIPTLPFVARRGGSINGLVHDQALLDRVFAQRPTEDAGDTLLERYGLHRGFPHYRPQSHSGRRRNVTVTLCGERRERSPLHRISIIVSDPDDVSRLHALGLPARPTKKNSPGWRYETAMADLGEVMRIVERIRDAFDGDVALVQYGRFGSGTSGETRTRSSLAMMPAASVRAGMVMFRANGNLASVRSVETLEGKTTLHDLDVERTHNFIANGIVTHNSIYGWRGAEVGNILRFEKDFPGAKVIRLERNYRSTARILGAASGLIAKNEGRLGKTLWTESPSGEEGERLRVRGLWDGEAEARFVGEEIEALQRAGEPLAGMAILLRTTAQMREFEDRFNAIGLPHRIVGGPRFYERLEVRDALAYLRVVAQPADDLAFERIVNKPKRGLGDATLKQLRQIARAQGLPLLETARRVVATDELKPKARKALTDVVESFLRWRQAAEELPHTELAETVLEESGYTDMWRQDTAIEAPGRLENLVALIDGMADFENLQGFLEHVGLVMESLQDSGGDQVSIMTLHAAKGLEFDTVFLAGWEEGLFPNQRALDETGLRGLEEERRLAYVGLTRARRRLFVTFAANRRLHGSWAAAIPSRFVDELPPEHVEVESDQGLYGQATAAWGGGFGRFGAGEDDPFGPRRTSPGMHRAQRYAESSKPFIEGTATVVQSLSPAGGFGAGDRVFHTKFGYGAVLRSEGEKLTVDFDHSGEKRVMAAFVVPADQAG